MSTVAPAATLRGFYEDIVKPALIRNQSSKSYLEIHESVVARFEIFCGADVPIEDITQDLLTRFEAHLWEAAPSKSRFRDLSDSLRRILGYRLKTPAQSRRFRPMLPEPPQGSLRLFFERIYIPHRLTGKEDSTVQSYRGVIHQLWEHYRRDIMLTEMTDELASEHSQWLLDLGRTPVTVNRVRRCWFAVWRYAHELGHCDTCPRLKKLAEYTQAPDAWNRDQMNRILASCKVHQGKTIKGIPADLWWSALLRVGYYTALRRRALFALTWADVDLEGATITAPPTIMKNRKGQKFLIGDDAVRALQAIEFPRRELLFPRNFDCYKPVYREFDAILNTAKVRGSKSNSPHFHKLRRSVATVIADTKGVAAAAELLGHSAPYITQRYVDNTQLAGHDYRDVLTPLSE